MQIDFSPLTTLDDPVARAAAIESRLRSATWDDAVVGCMRRGGWPQEARCERATIDDRPPQPILAHVDLRFIEALPGGCSLWTDRLERSARAIVSIDRSTGAGRLIELRADDAPDEQGDESSFSGDYA